MSVYCVFESVYNPTTGYDEDVLLKIFDSYDKAKRFTETEFKKLKPRPPDKTVDKCHFLIHLWTVE